MSDTHDCAAEGCTAQCRYEVLMCFHHWCMAPKAIQRAVNKAWRAFQEDAHNVTVYKQARQLAVDSVRHKQRGRI